MDASDAASRRGPRPWNLAATYFAFFASVGLEYVYLPYHFLAHGLSAAEVALVFTGRIVVKTLAQPIVPWLSDRLRVPHLTLKFSLALACVAGGVVVLARGFWPIALASWVQMLVRAPVIPLLDVTTIRTVGASAYGRIRLWGSAGYGAVVGLMGALAIGSSHDAAGASAARVYLGVAALAALVAWVLPRDEHAGLERPAHRTLLRPSFALIGFLVWNALHWVTLESYNLFFSLRLKELGLPSGLPGAATAVAISAEIAALWLIPRFLTTVGPAKLILISLALSVVRWWAVAVVTTGPALVALQALHAFSFGVWWASSLAVLGVFAPPEQRGGLHGLFAAVVLGVGGVIGTTAGGWLLAQHGGDALFYSLALVELLALLGAVLMRGRLRLVTGVPHGELPVPSEARS